MKIFSRFALILAPVLLLSAGSASAQAVKPPIPPADNQELRSPGGENQPGPGNRPDMQQRGMPGNPEEAERIFNLLDTNHDGKISLDEWLKREEVLKRVQDEERFKRADKEGKGALSLDDFKQLLSEQQRMRGMGRPNMPGMQGSMPGMQGGTPSGMQGGMPGGMPSPAQQFQPGQTQQQGQQPGRPGEAAPQGGQQQQIPAQQISPEERAKRMFQRFDKNGDGKISQEEFPGPPERFKALDKNGDGSLTEDELLEGLQQEQRNKEVSVEKQAKGGNGGGPGGPAGQPGQAQPPSSPEEYVKQMFKRLDKNGDSVISQDEFPGAPDRFKALDKNGDGALTEDEMLEGIKNERRNKNSGGPGGSVSGQGGQGQQGPRSGPGGHGPQGQPGGQGKQ